MPGLLALLLLCFGGQALWASQAATTTAVTLTSGGSAVTTVAARTAVTLTATVSAGGAPVTAGQVLFCDAAATYCEDAHLLGRVQVTTAGTAAFSFVPGPGTHSYKAVFQATNAWASSSSSVVGLAVTGLKVTASTLTATGSAGNYVLTDTVNGFGPVAPTGGINFLDTTNANYVLGTGTLGNPAPVLVGEPTLTLPSGGYGVALVDVNGDGILDVLATTGTNDSLAVWLGNGDGTFTYKSSTTTGQAGIYFATGDFNRDGKVDVAVSNYLDSSVTILLGNGDGTFAKGQTLTYGGWVYPYSVAVGDFDGDGILDLAVTDNGSYAVVTLHGGGDGTFTVWQKISLPTSAAVGGRPGVVVAADWNGDGKTDLAIADTNAPQMLILLGNGDGTFAVQPVGSAMAFAAADLKVADVNADGVPDLIAANATSNAATVLLGNGDGTFRLAANLPTGATTPVPQTKFAVAAGDFNGDGVTDLAVTTANRTAGGAAGNLVTLWIGKGDGTFTASSSAGTDVGPFGAATGDLNGDGLSDVVTQNITAKTIDVFLTANAATATLTGVSPVGDTTHYADAVYAGDGTHRYTGDTSSTVPLQAQKVMTNTALTAGFSSGRVMLMATVSPDTAQNHFASGSVAFTSNAGAVGAVSLVNGSATWTGSSLPAGTTTVTATYSGDDNFTGSAGPAAAPPTQTITFPQPPAPAYAVTSVTLSATASSGLPVTYTVISGPATVNGTTLSYLGAGTVVVEADQAGDSTYPAAAPVQDTVTVTLLTEPVATPNAPVSTVMTFLQNGTLGSITVTTQGAVGLDFNLASGGTCAVGIAYTAGQTCTVLFTFTPQHPGLRFGGVAFSAGDGTLLANSYLLGLGTGPQVLYNPPNQINVGSGFGGLSGVAVDGKDNVYIADYIGNGIYEFSASTGAIRLLTTTPEAVDVAVDGSGNVFFANRTSVGEILAVNGSVPAAPTVRMFTTALTALNGMKVDANGNVYLAASDAAGGNSSIMEIPAVNGAIPGTATIRTLISGMGGPTGVAIDIQGNVFVSDELGSSVYELVAVNGVVPPSPTVKIITTSLGEPTNATFDVSGNLYIPDAGTHAVDELLAVNGVVPVSPQIVLLGTGLVTPAGATVDPGGNLFVADLGLGEVVKLAYGNPPTYSFANTIVGQTSSDSPKTVTITNGGNADLDIPPPGTGTNASITAGFTIGSSSTCPLLTVGSAPATLAAGASCTTAISFSPTTVGTISGQLVRTDNNQNVPNSTQTILLAGVGLGIPPAIVFTVPNHTFGDPPFAVAATSNSPGAFTYSVVSGPATISGSTVTLTGAGTVVLQASQAASGTYAAGVQDATFLVYKEAQTINFPAPASPVTFGIAPITLSATASSGLPVAFSVISGPGQINGTSLTVTGGGTIVVAADQSGNDNFLAAPQVRHTIAVSFGPASVTLSAAPNPVFFTNPLTLSAAVVGAGGTATGSVVFNEGSTVLGSAFIVSGTASISLSTLSVGLHTITATYTGDVNFAAVTSLPVNVTVQDFRVTITNPEVTIVHGGTATFSLVVSSIGGVGLASTIHLTMSGGPDHAVSSFSQTDIATGSGSTPVTLTVRTPNYPTGPFGLVRSTGGVSFALLSVGAATLGLWRRRKRLGRRAQAMVLTLLLFGSVGACTLLSGCGSGWRTQGWSLTVTATSGNLSRSAGATITSECRDGAVACPIEAAP